jgi:hypothetical protein
VAQQALSLDAMLLTRNACRNMFVDSSVCQGCSNMTCLVMRGKRCAAGAATGCTLAGISHLSSLQPPLWLRVRCPQAPQALRRQAAPPASMNCSGAVAVAVHGSRNLLVDLRPRSLHLNGSGLGAGGATHTARTFRMEAG